jgi:Zn-dependent protease with chaperone function
VTYLTLGLSLAFSAFLASSLVGSFVAVLWWRLSERAVEGVRSESRAAGLFLLRVLPVVASVFAVGILLRTFYTFEPRETAERIGSSLVALAVAGALLIATGLWRAWRASRATSRLVRAWMAAAQPLELPGIRLRAYSIQAAYPVVSVVGILRPRLFVSERVLGECTPDELSAMAHHESRHLVSRDNLKRLLFRACPDPLSLTSVGRMIERQWDEASEEAADDYTVSVSGPSKLALATALLKVARMAPERSVRTPLLSWLHSGDSIDHRVRRLLLVKRPASSQPGWLVMTQTLALLPAIAALGVQLHPDLLLGVHRIIETVVQTLP